VVGDSCLFHTRKGQLLKCFPLERSEEFNNTPTLISSINSNNEGLQESQREASGDWEVGDTFYLMTDALACWFLQVCEMLGKDDVHRDFLDGLGTVGDQPAFEELVKLERAAPTSKGLPALRNDDQTLMRCTITQS
jgi:hypothetical protein